ncbi:isopentenyl-diphosphate Delta-isomerase [Actinoplanes sp. GCM10030250]|uniref:isopentenyl-diphosphate Delta-isomerase n=1 Tax=Actinoplanes sp. GCM10030250 TaxID=3273376 RepID=UPI003605B0D8
MTARESHLVELVGEDGTPAGSATVQEAHEAPGQLHRAFSVFLRDDRGRVLLQQRAATKTRFPLRWGNTCCGHPGPGEDLTVAAQRRLKEELGVAGMGLVEVGVYTYFAEDPMTGRVEREYDHVLLGQIATGTEFQPDPAEVARLRWTGLPDLRQRLESEPETYAPWLSGVAERLSSYLSSPSPLPSPPSGSAALERSGSSVPERSGGR